MLNSDSMYDDARQSKLQELRKLMVEQNFIDENGVLDSDALEDALTQATDGAEMGEMGEMEPGAAEEEGAEGPEIEIEVEEEETPLAIARRKAFKPEKKVARSPGTAMMIALGSSKAPMGKKMPKFGKA